jgi:dTDP-4-dehydrorhamnose reductase
MNILVTGSNGQLAREIRSLSKEYKDNFFFTKRQELDITQKKDIRDFIEKNSIDLIINSSAYTAVDRAEKEKEVANLVNSIGVQNLAEIAKAKSIVLIHISTDYVFDGKNYKPYIETDTPNPQNIYGQTKLKGEEAFRRVGTEGIIIRTSWVYSEYSNNFVKSMLRLKKRGELNIIFDQIGTPTYAKDLARVILEIIDRDFKKLKSLKGEIYHFSNEGVASWFDFAKAIFELKNINIKLNPILTKEYPTPAKRPLYSVLNKSKIKRDFNLKIPYWRDSLKSCLKRLRDE